MLSAVASVGWLLVTLLTPRDPVAAPLTCPAWHSSLPCCRGGSDWTIVALALRIFARRVLTTMTMTLVDRPVDGCANSLELSVRRGAFTAELRIVAEYDAAELGANWRQVRAARRFDGLDKPRPIISGRGEFIPANHRDGTVSAY